MDLTSVGGATSQPGSFARGGGGMGQVDSGAAGMAATSNGMTAQRKARRAAKRHYRNIVQSVLASVVGMLMMVVAGIMTYVASSQVEGQLIASLFLRCYVMCAMVEWRLVIELVRRPTTGGAGGGGARGYTGPSTTVPGTTTTTTLGGPPPALTLRGGQTDSFFAAAPSKPGLTSPPPVYDSAPSTPRSATLSTPRTLVGGSFPLEPLSPRAAMIDAPARTTSTLMRPTLSPPGSIAGPERYAEYQSPAAVSAAAAATAGAQRGSSARTSRVHF
ncbi:hypothetical protein BC828DRAFT_289015 [Blastocladiella britannica]|nr:hypothetical protein BC828DRAFT_289015 [Blastocladiella britannica]